MFFEIFRSQKEKGVIPIKRDFLEIAKNNIQQEKPVIAIVKISSTKLTKYFVPPSFLTPSSFSRTSYRRLQDGLPDI